MFNLSLGVVVVARGTELAVGNSCEASLSLVRQDFDGVADERDADDQ